MAGVAVAAQSYAYLDADPSSGVTVWLVTALAMLSSGGLLAGVLTPVTAVAVGLSTLVMAATSGPPAGSTDQWPASALVAADALALVMLGPGALSVDAWLFGRREIVVHDAPGRRGGR